jgi:hypothetical protein
MLYVAHAQCPIIIGPFLAMTVFGDEFQIIPLRTSVLYHQCMIRVIVYEPLVSRDLRIPPKKIEHHRRIVVANPWQIRTVVSRLHIVCNSAVLEIFVSMWAGDLSDAAHV